MYDVTVRDVIRQALVDIGGAGTVIDDVIIYATVDPRIRFK